LDDIPTFYRKEESTVPMLELSKKYTLQEIKDMHGISKKIWDTRREEVLEYLKGFYDYEIIQTGRSKYFVCEEVYDENYIPMPRKNKKQEIEKFYEEKTKEIIEESPRNTGMNIARTIVYGSDNVYEHAETTACRYVRPVINENYDRTDYQWCKFDEEAREYIPLTQEQIDFLANAYAGRREEDKQRSVDMFMKLADRVYNKEMTKKQMCAVIGKMTLTAYENAVKAFKEKFNFRPIAVPALVKKESVEEAGFTFE
jgi:hypothetical protein